MLSRTLAIALGIAALAAFPVTASAIPTAGSNGKSVGTIEVTFTGDYTSAGYSGTRGLSHYIVYDCLGNVEKYELSGDNKTYTITDLDGIAMLTVKAGTNVQDISGDCPDPKTSWDPTYSG